MPKPAVTELAGKASVLEARIKRLGAHDANRIARAFGIFMPRGQEYKRRAEIEEYVQEFLLPEMDGVQADGEPGALSFQVLRARRALFEPDHQPKLTITQGVPEPTPRKTKDWEAQRKAVEQRSAERKRQAQDFVKQLRAR